MKDLLLGKFGKDFFDGERKYGYGGYNYNPKYWTQVVKDFVDFFKLEDDAKIFRRRMWQRVHVV